MKLKTEPLLESGEKLFIERIMSKLGNPIWRSQQNEFIKQGVDTPNTYYWFNAVEYIRDLDKLGLGDKDVLTKHLPLIQKDIAATTNIRSVVNIYSALKDLGYDFKKDYAPLGRSALSDLVSIVESSWTSDMQLLASMKNLGFSDGGFTGTHKTIIQKTVVDLLKDPSEYALSLTEFAGYMGSLEILGDIDLKTLKKSAIKKALDIPAKNCLTLVKHLSNMERLNWIIQDDTVKTELPPVRNFM